MFRFVKRLLIMAGIGAIVRKVVDSKSQSSGSRSSAQWPPIKSPGNSSS